MNEVLCGVILLLPVAGMTFQYRKFNRRKKEKQRNAYYARIAREEQEYREKMLKRYYKN